MSNFLLEILYASGIFPIVFSAVSVRTFIAFLYLDTFGLSSLSASISWTLFCIACAIAEPWIGYQSDQKVSQHTRTLSPLHFFRFHCFSFPFRCT
jgi:Na+/melibiose symporter-like transporter